MSQTDEQPWRHPLPFGIGFLSLGTIAGLVVGYTVADFTSQLYGFEWYQSPYPKDRAFATKCLTIGPAIGFSIGFILDSVIRNTRIRNATITSSAYVTSFYLIFYLLFVASAYQSVRE